MKQKLRLKVFTALGLLLLILFLGWLNTHPDWIEMIYARKIYPVIGSVFRLLLGKIPFSLGDLLYLGAIAFLLTYLIRFFRSEEHTSELQSLMRISYAVFCLK